MCAGGKCPRLLFWFIIFLMTIFTASCAHFLYEVHKAGAVQTMLRKMDRHGTFLPDLLPDDEKGQK